MIRSCGWTADDVDNWLYTNAKVRCRNARLAYTNARLAVGGVRRSGGEGRQGGLGQHPDPEGQGTLVEVERRLVQVAHRAVARPHADTGHRTRHVLQVPGEVFAAARLLGRARGVRPEHGDR